MVTKADISLETLQSFGDVAAEDDPVLDYFLTTDAVQKIRGNEAFLVLGRKGSGKTALVRFFAEASGNTISKALNLRGYPWNVHSARIDQGAAEIGKSRVLIIGLAGGPELALSEVEGFASEPFGG